MLSDPLRDSKQTPVYTNFYNFKFAYIFEGCGKNKQKYVCVCSYTYI